MAVLPGDTVETRCTSGSRRSSGGCTRRRSAVLDELAAGAARAARPIPAGAGMRALLSVYDKTGPGRAGRAAWPSSAGSSWRAATPPPPWPRRASPTAQVADVTGSPEMLDGRVKTLHPAIHGGILADRSKPEHLADLAAQGIEPIDLVVCNLYPFSSDPSIELIDVGGPTMVRGAAKNLAHVGVVVSPDDYGPVLDELRAARVRCPTTTRRRLARAAFAHTAGLRRGHRRRGSTSGELPARRRCTSPWSGPRCSATARTRTSTAPATGWPAAQSWWDGPMQHGGPGALLPQPLRHRRRLAAGPRARRRRRPAGGGDHQARQPLRRARWPTTSPTAYRLALECDPQLGLRRRGGDRAGRRRRRWPRSIAAGPQADVIVASAIDDAARGAPAWPGARRPAS